MGEQRRSERECASKLVKILTCPCRCNLEGNGRLQKHDGLQHNINLCFCSTLTESSFKMIPAGALPAAPLTLIPSPLPCPAVRSAFSSSRWCMPESVTYMQWRELTPQHTTIQDNSPHHTTTNHNKPRHKQHTTTHHHWYDACPAGS